MLARPKVVLLHNIMAPYRFPLFRALANHSEIDLTVWFMAQSARNRMWSQSRADLGFKYEVLPNVALSYFSTDLFSYTLNYTFPWRYVREPIDVLISAGWLDFASQAGFVLSKVLRRKFILWSESTVFEPSWRRSLAAPLVRTIVRGADACVAVGMRSKQYLRSLGAEERDVFTAISTVDVDLFRRVSTAARPNLLANRGTFNIRRNRVMMYCGQFIERKGLRHLIESFALIKREYEDLALVLVGYGPTRAELIADVKRQGLADVHFIDHVEVGDMPKLYALADVFVLPSIEETWGLVVNEALACGVPVIVSDRVGSSVDLVRDGENGFVVPAGDATSIAYRALRMLSDSDLMARLSSGAAATMTRFTPDHAASGFISAVKHAWRPPESI